MKYAYLFFLFLLAASGKCLAQDAGDSHDDDDSTAPHGVIVHADDRLAIITKKHIAVQHWGNGTGIIRSGRGFRVQIYSGSDRAKATQTKIDFLRRFPGVRSYLSYIAPTFRVKVGDFRSRAEAQRMYSDVSHIFTPCMIVPDIIEINTFHGHD